MTAQLRAGEREARIKTLNAIDDLARALDVLYNASDDPPMLRQDVVIDSSGIRVTECPTPPPPPPGGPLEDHEAEA